MLITVLNEYIVFLLSAEAKFSIERWEYIIVTEKQNNSFINKNCEICGHNDLILSSVQLCCNYGSKYDGESIVLNICGNCADKIFEAIKDF